MGPPQYTFDDTARAVVRKPLLIRVAPWILGPAALMGLAFSGVMTTARWDGAQIGPFANPGAQSIVIVFSIAFHAATAVGAYALYAERPWSRWLLTVGLLIMIVLLCVGLVAVTPVDSHERLHVLELAVHSTLGIAVASAYLFGKSNVRRYYGNLQSRADSRAAPV